MSHRYLQHNVPDILQIYFRYLWRNILDIYSPILGNRSGGFRGITTNKTAIVRQNAYLAHGFYKQKAPKLNLGALVIITDEIRHAMLRFLNMS